MTREGHPGVAPAQSPIYRRVGRCAPTTATRRTSCASPSASRCCRQSRHEARRPRIYRRRVPPGGRPAAAPFGDHDRVDPRPRRRAAVGPTRRGSVHARTLCDAERGDAACRWLTRDEAVADRERAVGLCAITLGRVRRQPTRPGEFDGDTTTRKGREGINCPASSNAPAATDPPTGPPAPRPRARDAPTRMWGRHTACVPRGCNSTEGVVPVPPRRTTPIAAAPRQCPQMSNMGRHSAASTKLGVPRRHLGPLAMISGYRVWTLSAI